eukprot:CAMPEP_0196584320 /NCGR_PEP_ID=MMETSP1081-20130531/46638_1 /TAXON_ID=36882 /ORGANISM="Pyramimonas amylifera, Strain CCMP720" /LENGTH=327 /DNA_ID=CAMNT_0041905487 /DNA_START=76 /DNA_END=1055 /DNA_ORIENTATION=+
MAKKQLPGPRPLEGGVSGKAKNFDKSLSAVKREIRSLERLLKREGLPMELREAKEAQLASLQGKRVERVEDIKGDKYDKKYKHIRFFEQRKVERRIHNLDKLVAEGGSLTAEQGSLLKSLKEDLEYILHFPRCEKYIALFVSPSEEVREETEAKQRSIRQRIKVDLANKENEDAEMNVVTEVDEGIPSRPAPVKKTAKADKDKVEVEKTKKTKKTTKLERVEKTHPRNSLDLDFGDSGEESPGADAGGVTEEKEEEDSEDNLDEDDDEAAAAEGPVIEDPFFLEGAQESDEENETATHKEAERPKTAWQNPGRSGGRGSNGQDAGRG